MPSAPKQNPVAKPAPPMPHALRGPWLPIVVGGVCFLSALGNDFVRDDTYVVSANPRIRSLANFREIWFSNWWHIATDDGGLPPAEPDRLYRPFTLFTFALNYAVGGLHPAGFLFVNLLLHATTCGLVWLLAKRLCGDARVALVAALLFAAHPIHCEAVANVVGRADVLAALFLAAGMIALLPAQGAPSGKRGLIAAGLFLVALLSKESAVCYVGLAAVLLALRRPAAPASRRFAWLAMHTVILLAPLAVYLPLRYAVLGGLAESGVTERLVNPLVGTAGIDRIIGVFSILGCYARAVVFPVWLSSDYGLAIVDPHAGLTFPAILGVAIAAVIVIGLAGFATRRATWRCCASLALMFLLSYGLISNAVLLIGTSLGERLFYWPSVPVFIAIAVLALAMFDRLRAGSVTSARLAIGVGAVILLALGTRAILRNLDWRSGARLTAVDVANWPASAQLQASQAWYLGDAVARNPNIPDAEATLRRAQRHAEDSLRIAPDNTVAMNLLAEVLRRRGDDAAAIDVLLRLVARRPDEWRAHANLTEMLAGRDPVAALVHARAAHRLEPRSRQTQLNLASALADNNEFAESLVILRQVERELPPDHELRRPVAEMIRSLEQAVQSPPGG